MLISYIKDIIISYLDYETQIFIYRYINFNLKLLNINRFYPLRDAIKLNNEKIIHYICNNFNFDFYTFFDSIETFIKFEERINIVRQIELLLKNCHKYDLLPEGLDDGYYLWDIHEIINIMQNIIVTLLCGNNCVLESNHVRYDITNMLKTFERPYPLSGICRNTHILIGIMERNIKYRALNQINRFLPVLELSKFTISDIAEASA